MGGKGPLSACLLCFSLRWKRKRGKQDAWRAGLSRRSGGQHKYPGAKQASLAPRPPSQVCVWGDDDDDPGAPCLTSLVRS